MTSSDGERRSTSVLYWVLKYILLGPLLRVLYRP
ncbi:MAG TPA: 1-acyl-sn-glycerol-3-phosphate acyltransferase, partial [Actinobacteria bacterium]|nr:1-acyl-sn-glycerol-3-phosphate acyltransferase [Actinomycetota bacterium]